MSLEFSKTKHGERRLLAQRDGWDNLSVQSRKEEETGRKETRTPLAQRDGWDNLCRARKGKSGVKTKRDA